MLFPLAAVLVLTMEGQAVPIDVDARLASARTDLRQGRVTKAESEFRDVLAEHPDNIDAWVGLGSTLLRRGEWSLALKVLREAEARATGENSDLYAALARAYRRAGDFRSALEYFRRAKALAPEDADIVSGYQSTALAYGHTISVEGFGEHLQPSSGTGSGTLATSVRATDSLHVDASLRMQSRTGTGDSLAGGGVFWQAMRATTIGAHVLAGPGNTTLARSDMSTDVMHYVGVFELGASARRMNFIDADVLALSPLLTWDPGGRWRLDARYTRSRSAFTGTGGVSGDNSIMFRETWRGWRRVWLNATYASGIESFEDLTADRIGSLASTTVAGGVRVMLPSLVAVAATWEHQRRANDTSLDRFTLGFVRAIP